MINQTQNYMQHNPGRRVFQTERFFFSIPALCFSQSHLFPHAIGEGRWRLPTASPVPSTNVAILPSTASRHLSAKGISSGPTQTADPNGPFGSAHRLDASRDPAWPNRSPSSATQPVRWLCPFARHRKVDLGKSQSKRSIASLSSSTV
jgi:hypothetical protein